MENLLLEVDYTVGSGAGLQPSYETGFYFTPQEELSTRLFNTCANNKLNAVC